MSEVGYCTLEDVRRALRKADLPGDVGQDEQIAVDAILAETEPLERSISRHFYEPTGIDEASEITIATEPKTRDDEHDLSTRAGMVHGTSERDRYRYRENSDALLESDPRSDRWRKSRREPKREIRIATGPDNALDPPVDESVPAYTRITLERHYVDAINKLLVIGADGSYTDWVASDEFDGGVGLDNRGSDYWARINSGGVTELYLDVHAMDDDLASLSNTVYVDFDHGHEGIPPAVRRAVALRAGAELVEDAVIEIPSNTTLYNVETKAERMREKADELLEEYGGKYNDD
ncbi:hypothetical protein BJ1_gp56 [Halorubrum virus BJ1]|uniref:Uncharacterized protein n=1 Tax=Halorubrum virus BJ1 TaxID=416419 RepID=A0ZYR9_9CAUD|nr:hypothetical protein BJ1_gp56 [Halorubrum virus BJ1]CAL92478.1 hypothetical protein [Halorubrum virus BJ1]